jgi:hypothetical protein
VAIAQIATALLALVAHVNLPADTQPSLVVVGKGSAVAVADVGYVALYVRGTGPTMNDALLAARSSTANLEKAMKEHLKGKSPTSKVELVSMGARTDDVWRVDSQRSETLEVVYRITLSIPPDVLLAAQVVDIAVRYGASLRLPTNVRWQGDREGAVFFGAQRDIEKHEAAAQIDAIKAGRAVASEMAEASAMKLGALIGVEPAAGWCDRGEWRVDGRELPLPTRYVSSDPSRVDIKACYRMTFQTIPK